jgi:hypothetical protein
MPTSLDFKVTLEAFYQQSYADQAFRDEYDQFVQGLLSQHGHGLDANQTSALVSGNCFAVRELRIKEGGK